MLGSASCKFLYQCIVLGELFKKDVFLVSVTIYAGIRLRVGLKRIRSTKILVNKIRMDLFLLSMSAVGVQLDSIRATCRLCLT